MLARAEALVAVLLGLSAVVVPDAQADSEPAAKLVKRVAVYPLEAPSAELRIYSRPIAEAVAKGLSSALGVEVKVLESAGDAPKGIDLVVDGSILRDKRGVKLEARVRDPDSGRQIGAASAGVRPLEDLESSATELAERLVPIAASWRKKERSRPAVRLQGSVLEVPRPQATRDSRRTPARAASSQRRPPLFVIPSAGGNAAGGAVRIDVDATEAAYAFAERLGASYVESDATGSDEAITLANAVRSSGAIYALALYLREVTFNYRGVLSARGSAVIRLIDRDGMVVLQTSVQTDTVVGSRGDRHTALIYSVAEQCLDIALPELKKALAR